MDTSAASFAHHVAHIAAPEEIAEKSVKRGVKQCVEKLANPQRAGYSLDEALALGKKRISIDTRNRADRGSGFRNVGAGANPTRFAGAPYLGFEKKAIAFNPKVIATSSDIFTARRVDLSRHIRAASGTEN